MAASIFKTAWWPLHVVVAWVLTRNHSFVAHSNRARSLGGVGVLLASSKVHGKPIKRYFKSVLAAWIAVREEMAAGHIRLSGSRFRRVAVSQGLAVETTGPAREIPAAEIASLGLQDDGKDRDCLVPKDWRVAHGSNWNNSWGYRNVLAFRDDVLSRYPAAASKVSSAENTNDKIEPTPTTPATSSTESIGSSVESDTTVSPVEVSEAIAVDNEFAKLYLHEQLKQPPIGPQVARERASRAIQTLYPDGVPDQFTVPNTVLFRQVGDWLKERKLPNVSDATISRAAGRRK
jgi:hypothetical protein